MATQTNGLEFKRFYADDAFWPQGLSHEEETVTVNGAEVSSESCDYAQLSDADAIGIEGGEVRDKHGKVVCSLEEHFLQWRKKQASAPLFVEVPREKRDAIIAAIVAAGGRVI